MILAGLTLNGVTNVRWSASPSPVDAAPRQPLGTPLRGMPGQRRTGAGVERPLLRALARIALITPLYAGLILLAAAMSPAAGLATAIAGVPVTLHLAGLGLSGHRARGSRRNRISVTVVSAFGSAAMGLAAAATVLPLLGAWSLAAIPPAMVALHRIVSAELPPFCRHPS